MPYIDAQLANGARLHHVVRHMLGLYQGQYGGRQYRRHLSEHAHQATSGSEVLREAIAFCSAPEQRYNARRRGVKCLMPTQPCLLLNTKIPSTQRLCDSLVLA
jgi:tRNA-dihydrouridine synthase A